MDWLLGMLPDVFVVKVLPSKDDKNSLLCSGVQIRVLESAINIGAQILSKGDIGDDASLVLELDKSRATIRLDDLEIDIIEDNGRRYISSVSVPGITRVVYSKRNDNPGVNLLISRTL